MKPIRLHKIITKKVENHLIREDNSPAGVVVVVCCWKEEVDAARHRQEKREATRLGTLLSQTGV